MKIEARCTYVTLVIVMIVQEAELHWGPWSYSPCSVTCGVGKRIKSRTCIGPKKFCRGTKSKIKTCINRNCGMTLGWSEWQQGTCLSVYPKVCGNSVMTLNRTCLGPPAKQSLCIGPDTKKIRCQTQICPIHGLWTRWITTNGCSTTCNVGTITFQRKCVKQYGGDSCSNKGKQIKYQSCQKRICEVKGSWSSWVVIKNNCATNCGIGTKIKQRKCDNPRAQYGSKSVCPQGKNETTYSCKYRKCKRTNEWSQWQTVNKKAMSSCGIHKLKQTRTCYSTPCIGFKKRVISIQIAICPVDARYVKDSKVVHDCRNDEYKTTKCGIHYQQFEFLCSSLPKAQYGGKSCKESLKYTLYCYQVLCDAKGNVIPEATQSTSNQAPPPPPVIPQTIKKPRIQPKIPNLSHVCPKPIQKRKSVKIDWKKLYISLAIYALVICLCFLIYCYHLNFGFPKDIDIKEKDIFSNFKTHNDELLKALHRQSKNRTRPKTKQKSGVTRQRQNSRRKTFFMEFNNLEKNTANI